MLTFSKKIRKPNKLNIGEESNSNISSDKKLNDKKKGLRCRYRNIPTPSRVDYSNKIYFIPGDLYVAQIDERVVSELSFMNEYKVCRDLTTMEMYGQKVLGVKVEDRNAKIVPNCSELVEELINTEIRENIEWAQLIQTFAQKYQRIFGRQCKKKPQSDLRKNYLTSVTQETLDKKDLLFEQFACIEMKYRARAHRTQLNEIVFSEKFLRYLGYSIDEFASVLLLEGIPQIMAIDNSVNSTLVKKLLQKYFNLGEENLVINEPELLLFMKRDYVRKVNFSYHCFVNYEANVFGLDIVIAINSEQEPFVSYKEPNLGEEINQNFIKAMAAKERERAEFLQKFYDKQVPSYYRELERICKIKEVKLEEEELSDVIKIEKIEYEDF